MDTLQDAYKDEEESNGEENQIQTQSQNQSPKQNPIENVPDIIPSDPIHSSEPKPEPEPKPENEPEVKAVEPTEVFATTMSEAKPEHEPEPMAKVELEERENNVEMESELGANLGTKGEPLGSEDMSTDSISEDEQKSENFEKKLANEDEFEEQQPEPKKQKSITEIEIDAEIKTPMAAVVVSKKSSSKKKSKSSNNVWTKPTSRKGKKKAKNNNHIAPKSVENKVMVTPIPRFPDRNDDTPEGKICLSKVYKAEKVELGDDRMSAGSCKGYRMVRATRGVSEGAWFFEIKVVHLGETGHTRLGWSTEKGDLQAPVGYDGNSFGYRDIDGSKIHKALREKYGEEGYKEGDVIGFYINLPDGDSYAPKPPHLVYYKGQKYVCAQDPKEDPPKTVPGSEISFFKNGICQGVAFKDLHGGRYYPAASMYTLPNQPNCVVKFNFGPDFECFPPDFEGRPVPKPMIEVPYHGFVSPVENGVLNEQKQ